MGVTHIRNVTIKRIQAMQEHARVHFTHRMMDGKGRVQPIEVARIAHETFYEVGKKAAELVDGAAAKRRIQKGFEDYGLVRSIETLCVLQNRTHISDHLDRLMFLNAIRAKLAQFMFASSSKQREMKDRFIHRMNQPVPETINRDELRKLKRTLIEQVLRPELGGRAEVIVDSINQYFVKNERRIHDGIRLTRGFPTFDEKRVKITIQPEQ
jgi:hypothetical protein